MICASCGCLIGVCIIEEESGDKGITMELEMQWDGNPNIVLDINTRVGVALPIQVIFDLVLGFRRVFYRPRNVPRNVHVFGIGIRILLTKQSRVRISPFSFYLIEIKHKIM